MQLLRILDFSFVWVRARAHILCVCMYEILRIKF